MAKGAQTEAFAGVFRLLEQNPAMAIVAGVAAVAVVVAVARALNGAKPKQKTTLRTDQTIPLKLAKKIIVSHDTRIFRFALPSEEHILGLPIGKHVMVSAEIKGSNVQRPYTPISSDDDQGFVDLLVKVYRAGVHPKFPDGGLMSQHMDTLKEGVDTLNFRGPTGRTEYRGRGVLFMKQAERKVTHLNMIGGGTGITPLLQVIRAILKDPQDTTKVNLLFANQTEEDILLRAELDECAKDPRVKVWYTLDRPGDGWKYSSGFVSADMIADHLAPASPTTVCLMCGPPPMITHACKPNLEKLGHEAANFVVF